MQVTLDILVEALGRVNFGCVWDYKGLTSPDIKLNGERPAEDCHGLLSVEQLPPYAIQSWRIRLHRTHLQTHVSHHKERYSSGVDIHPLMSCFRRWVVQKGVYVQCFLVLQGRC